MDLIYCTKGFSVSSQAKADIASALSKYRGETINFEILEAPSLVDMVEKLTSGDCHYLLLPSRLTSSNEISPVCLDLILRCHLDKINEIFTGVDKAMVYRPFTEEDEAAGKYPVWFGNSRYIEDEAGVQPGEEKGHFVEYKIFKLNNVKTKPGRKILNFFFARKYSNLVIRIFKWTTSILAIAMFFLSLFGVFNELKVASQIISVSVLIMQMLLSWTDIESRICHGLIKGYWIYYSFSDSYEQGMYVPKGFTTRLLNIQNESNVLSMQCEFSGSDTLFWESNDIKYSFNYKAKMAKGMYNYNANITNAKGRRPEGTCLFQGKTVGNDQVTYMDGHFIGRGTGQHGQVKYLRITKEDYEFIRSSFPARAAAFEKSVTVIGIFGNRGSNTDVAFDSLFSDKGKFAKNLVTKKHFSTFGELYYALLRGEINDALVPVSNRGNDILINFQGEEMATKQLFGEFHPSPLGEQAMKIGYVVASRNKEAVIDENTVFLSNVESLKQCRDYICERKTIVYPSTADAARAMSLGECGDNEVVICNDKAALIYGLHILWKDGKKIDPYCEEEENVTSFVLYSK